MYSKVGTDIKADELHRNKYICAELAVDWPLRRVDLLAVGVVGGGGAGPSRRARF